MVNDQSTRNRSRRSLLHVLYSEKLPLHVSPSRVSSRPSRPRESKTSDFAAYYRQGSSWNCDPAFSVTSHHTGALPPPPRSRSPPSRLLLHTYPCNAVTWNPYVETSSFEDGCVWKDTRCLPLDFRSELDCKGSDDDINETSFHCRCVKCTDSRCPGKYNSSLNPPANSPYRTAIMTFRDQYTMTLKMNEAATAVTPVPSYHVLDDSDASCDYAIRGTPRTFTPDRGKPICKNSNKVCKEYGASLLPMLRDPSPPRPERSPFYRAPPEHSSTECEIDRREEERVVIPSRLSSFFKFMKKKDPHTSCSRRPIYNEGISDLRAGNVSSIVRRERIPSATNTTKLPRKSSVKSKCCIDESKPGTPHAHHNDSKFHQHCTDPARFGGADVPRPRRVVASSRVYKPAMPANYPAPHFTPPARTPRKLLTSERNVDSYSTGPTYASTVKHLSKRN